MHGRPKIPLKLGDIPRRSPERFGIDQKRQRNDTCFVHSQERRVSFKEEHRRRRRRRPTSSTLHFRNSSRQKRDGIDGYLNPAPHDKIKKYR